MAYQPTEEDLLRFRSSLALLKLAVTARKGGTQPDADQVGHIMADMTGEKGIDRESAKIIGTLAGAAGCLIYELSAALADLNEDTL